MLDSMCSICNEKLHELGSHGNHEVLKLACSHSLHFDCVTQVAESLSLSVEMACPYKCHSASIAHESIGIDAKKHSDDEVETQAGVELTCHAAAANFR